MPAACSILDTSPESPAFRSQAEARRISLRAAAQVEAELGATWPDGCRQAGEMARKVVMAGIAPEKIGQDVPGCIWFHGGTPSHHPFEDGIFHHTATILGYDPIYGHPNILESSVIGVKVVKS